MRILFVKTSSLGDVVHHLPAVSDAVRAIPGASIDWVIEEAFAAVAAMHPAVRRVIPVALRRWRSALWHPAMWSELGAFRRALAAERYDAVVDTQGLLKSALVAKFASGAKHGMDRASAREPCAARFYNATHAVPRELHAVERNRRLAAASLGYGANGACDYGLRAEGAAPLDAGGPFAVLLTMTSREDKLWPQARWVELGRLLAARGVKSVLPWGSEAEHGRAERIARGIGEALVPRRFSLEELGRLFRAARGVAGGDTGLTHFAAALGAPTVGLYCGSDPALTGLYGCARAKTLGAPGAPPAAAEAFEAIW
ncbi:MAG: lipopolysaccharide heptosyltransferase I [Betaproteobacteria bacterium RIFCSPHIGHO2_12_FULL_69_13]|nr:MAG: lipopolysaccharide heptosyltransferase I [Betaproteobacteria bacterium RIFCSPHIGHO2_12_FULL_69_13]OGA68323.1 MAG: lipopolysaccharide heptosyltransferase I [Betaproteobacteria bacterium RIFCSPLOWO2_12_FULL_68_20]